MTSLRRAAVLPCCGIGDALLMMIASHRLKAAGYEVTTFHPALLELSHWFPGHFFKKWPTLEDLFEYDWVVVENDNSPHIHSLAQARARGQIKRLSVFFLSHSCEKNPSLRSDDRLFDQTKSMVDNISWAISDLIGSSELIRHNGLHPPQELIFRKHRKRILIHPTSSSEKKNWKKEYFIALAQKLQKKGFSPIFAMSPKERQQWKELGDQIDIPLLPSLDDLARLLYESGGVIGNDSLLGHLASNMGLPSLIIADNEKRMQLWQPGWHKGDVVTPPRWLPNIKGARLRERYWKFFIKPRAVFAIAERLFG